MHSVDVVLMVATLLLSAAATGLTKSYAQRAKLMDLPNQRSSHEVATPRGGGLGIVVVFLGAVAGIFMLGDLPGGILISLFVGGALIAGIGFIDDHGHVDAKWRFMVQVAAVSFAVSVLGGLPEIRIGESVVDLGFFGDVCATVFTVWFINLFNFMDGIDGIAAVEALCIALGALIIMATGDSGFVTHLIVVFAGSTLGFLVWNWPPAKIFMGDIGSGFIGFVLAMFAVISTNGGLMTIWSWLILAGVFVVDATITLVTRMIGGERWYLAHNSHAYQKISRRWKRHRPVTLAVLLVNIAWLLPIAWYAGLRPEFGWWLTAVAWTPLVALALGLKAGRREQDG